MHETTPLERLLWFESVREWHEQMADNSGGGGVPSGGGLGGGL